MHAISQIMHIETDSETLDNMSKTLDELQNCLSKFIESEIDSSNSIYIERDIPILAETDRQI